MLNRRAMTDLLFSVFLKLIRTKFRMASEDGKLDDMQEAVQGMGYRLNNENLRNLGFREMVDRIRYENSVFKIPIGNFCVVVDSFLYRLSTIMVTDCLACTPTFLYVTSLRT